MDQLHSESLDDLPPKAESTRKELYNFPDIMLQLQTAMNAMSHFHSEMEFWREKAIRAETLNETLIASIEAQEDKMSDLETKLLISQREQIVDPMTAPPPPPPPPPTPPRTPSSRASSRASSQESQSASSPSGARNDGFDMNRSPSNRSMSTQKATNLRGDEQKERSNENLQDLYGDTSNLVSGGGKGMGSNQGILGPEMKTHSPKHGANGNYTSLTALDQGMNSDASNQHDEERDDGHYQPRNDDDKSVESENSSILAMQILNNYLNDASRQNSKRSMSGRPSAVRSTSRRSMSGRSASGRATFEC